MIKHLHTILNGVYVTFLIILMCYINSKLLQSFIQWRYLKVPSEIRTHDHQMTTKFVTIFRFLSLGLKLSSNIKLLCVFHLQVTIGIHKFYTFLWACASLLLQANNWQQKNFAVWNAQFFWRQPLIFRPLRKKLHGLGHFFVKSKFAWIDAVARYCSAQESHWLQKSPIV